MIHCVIFIFQEDSTDLVYAAGEMNEHILQQWTTDKCVPLVREITFENAEVGAHYQLLLLALNSSVDLAVV